jgi:Arc/MetJ-type ribon-helix-helix transcriptional regulator
MKKKTVIPMKKRGPPATGKGEPIAVRMHPPQLKALDAWIAQQEPPFPSRPEAVRRLLELALANSKKQLARYPEKPAAKAMELASEAIDGWIPPHRPTRRLFASAACSRAHRFFETYASISRNEPSAAWSRPGLSPNQSKGFHYGRAYRF